METLQATTSIGKRDEQVAGRRRSPKKQTQERPAAPVKDAFLKHQFLPLYEPPASVPERTKTEKGFFKALAHLSDSFGIKPMEVSQYPYPYNILLARWDAYRQLNTTDIRVELDIVSTAKGKVQLTASQQYYTGELLYFIPVMPLFRLMKDRKQKASAALLLSVFAYLFRYAGIPYYRDDYSATGYYYEILKDWLDNDMESYTEKEYNEQVSDLYGAEYYGNVMFRRIFCQYNTDTFGERLGRFKPRNMFEIRCLQVAREAYSLMSQFPDRTIFQYTQMETEQDENDADECIRAEQYVSFIANNEGWVYEQMCSMINSEFNECVKKEDPCIVRFYGDSKLQDKDTLEFEQRLFPMILDLIDVLNMIP